MVAMTEARNEVRYRVDGIGGVRCKKCGEPFFKVGPSPGEEKPSGIVFLRHKACGHYNVVDLGQLIYS